GDSLSAMRVIAEINTGLDAHLGVRTLFEAPTIGQLVAHVGAGGGRFAGVVASERPAVVPLSFAQSRLWFIDQLHGPSPVYNMAAALRLNGHLGAGARCSPPPRGYPSRWWCRPREPMSDGRPLTPPVGHRPGWKAPSATPHGTPSNLRPKSHCEHGFSGSATPNTCWWPWCTTSPPTGGR